MAASESRPASAWNPRDEFVRRLAESVQPILDSQDTRAGRFGTQPWICMDQNVVLPLAAAWAIKHRDNPWYHKKALLNAIMLGGDALVDDQDAQGKWTFRKKDGSTWGQIAQPWTYTRWIRAFALIRDAMPARRRAKWGKGLLLGYEGISKRELNRFHNIPCHHAMGLYCAGQVFGRDDWKQQAQDFMRKMARRQKPDGYWLEHNGPVVLYNYVYSESIGCYYALSKDRVVLPHLRRAAVYHSHLVYPDGTDVGTVDGRNPYHPGRIGMGNVGFTVTPEGRGFLVRQLDRLKAAGKKVGADYAAQILLYGETGPAKPVAADTDQSTWTSKDGKIAVLRRAPWFVVASAHTGEVPDNRWGQDRQNFLSIFHDRVGLIAGGGNTKLQPYWSNFTIGDRSLLKHKRGDASPAFLPPAGLVHVPGRVSVRFMKGRPTAGVRLDLHYGDLKATVEVLPESASRLRLVYACEPSGKRPVFGHVTLLPHVGRKVRAAAGASQTLSSKPIDWPAKTCGGWTEHAGSRITLPAGTRLIWPKKAHNPYRKTGLSYLPEARLVIEMPFDRTRTRYEFSISVK